MDLVIIAAMGKNREIGVKGDLPWHIPKDLKHFKELTLGHPCIMGDLTYEGLPIKPLPKRDNLVLSLDENYKSKGAVVFPSWENLLTYCDQKNYEKAFVCGGGTIYKQALSLANKMELTLIDKTRNDADTFFPKINFNEWNEIDRKKEDFYSFVTYERK